MTLSDPSICGIFGSSLSKLSLYIVFEDPLQGISYCLPFLPRAFMEFIGRDKTREHTCNAYIVKSSNGSKEKNVIQSNQDVHMCGIFGGYIWWLT